MGDNEEIFKKVRQLLEGGLGEIKEKKKVLIDKKTGQASIKIPKKIALKLNLDENSVFDIVFNPKIKDTKDKMNESKFVIYLREE